MSRLHALRKKLLALNYDEPVGNESLALVERLFADLVTTTESYEALLNHEGELSQELALTQSQLFPLRKDNAHLVRENNQLHLEMIKQSEEGERKLCVEFEARRRAEAEAAEVRLSREASLGNEGLARVLSGRTAIDGGEKKRARATLLAREAHTCPVELYSS